MTAEKFSTLRPELVQLGTKKGPATITSRLAAGPLADKFFAIGAFSGLLGILGLGVPMWLVLNNQLPPLFDYSAHKNYHVVIQTYLFFGLFILGFCFQAGPKLFNVSMRPRALNLAAIPLIFLGTIIWLAWPALLIGQMLVSAAFMLGIIHILKLNSGKLEPANKHRALLILFGLAVFVLSPVFSLVTAKNAVMFFWFGIASVIFAAGEQFICNFLGGAKSTGKLGNLFRLSYLLSFVITLSLLVVDADLHWKLLGGVITLTIILYLAATNAQRWPQQLRSSPLALAFIFAVISALSGGVMLASKGAAYADLVFHIWALGWGMTLIMAVSMQIMSFLSSTTLLKPLHRCLLLTAWQIVSFGRGMIHIFELPAGFSWVVGVVGVVVVGVWGVKIIRAEIQIVRVQFRLKGGEVLKSC